MVYAELSFRAKCILEERDRVARGQLTAASFTAWQILQTKVEKLPKWGTYIKELGLSGVPRATKEDLEREAEQAMKNAQRIIERAKKAGYVRR